MANVSSLVNRRGSLLACAAGVASLTLGWARRAGACGSGVEYEEEEVLDLASGAGEPARELAHFVVGDRNVAADHRFSVSPNGDVLCFADRSTAEFCVEDSTGQTRRLAAPAGGTATFTADGRALVLQLQQVRYDQILFANPHTGEHERWSDFFDAEPLALAPGGLVVAHQRDGKDAGALSWVTGVERVTELVRTAEVPKHAAVGGSRVAYFLGGAAFTVELGEPSRAPKSLGQLSKPATGAVWSAAGFVATNPDGAWLLRSGRAPRLLVAEANLRAPLAHRGTLVFGSARRIWFWRGQTPRSVEAPHANLHFTGTIAGTNDFILCRGPSVYRYGVKTGQLERLGSGRPGMKLRGAALFGERLLTWSSRTWVRTGWGCSAESPPTSFVVD